MFHFVIFYVLNTIMVFAIGEYLDVPGRTRLSATEYGGFTTVKSLPEHVCNAHKMPRHEIANNLTF